MIEIEIDGQKLIVEEGSMIIEAADRAGIYIPRFCYHKKLSIAANCRMCLVEVEKSRKSLPACATPVTAGMKVKTHSAQALESQQAVMEFLLVNHPLDCPVCDQGGECELQDLSLGFGKDHSDYDQGKRSVAEEDIGPLIDTAMTRCIQCTRCIRFGDEIAGMRELGATGRGENMTVGTYVKHMLRSELSGNVIDLCPVGALTSKPYQSTARAWEMREHPAIAPHDCVGSNIFIHSKGEEYSPARQVMRVVPRENHQINEMWISDRNRFSYQGLQSEERIVSPMVKREGQWEAVSWQVALNKTAEMLHEIIEKYSANEIAALASPNSTLETLYLLQKFMRDLGSAHMDHRLRQTDFSDDKTTDLYPSLNMRLKDLQQLDQIFLLGSNIRYEAPIIGHHIRQAVIISRAKVHILNPHNYPMHFRPATDLIAPFAELPLYFAKIVKAAAALKQVKLSEPMEKLLAEVEISEAAKQFVATFAMAKNSAIILGADAINHPQAAALKALAKIFANIMNAKYAVVSEGANTIAGHLAGVLPLRGVAGEKINKTGYNTHEMFANKRKAYLLLNVEPEDDCSDAALALEALKQAKCVIAISSFASKHLKEYADVILPAAVFCEDSGTFINAGFDWQQHHAIAAPQGEARPAWKILRVLANLLQLAGYQYVNHQEIFAEFKAIYDASSKANPQTEFYPKQLQQNINGLQRLGSWHMYSVDNLVRRASALQACITDEQQAICINSKLATTLQVKTGDEVVAVQHGLELKLPVVVDERVADNTVVLAAGMENTCGFGEAFGNISLHRS